MTAGGPYGADTTLIEGRRWDEARRRAAVLGGLTTGETWRRPDVRAAAADLGLRGLGPPSPSTVRRRLRSLTAAEQRRRGGSRKPVRPITGATPDVTGPLALVQVDHAKVDLILVDPFDREPIGRPWLTVAVDVMSRCIAGFHLSLEPPSAASVGLCLIHVASNKSSWLEVRGIVGARWPIAGKPRRLGVDNGREFDSLAFERGCERHGIAIDRRPLGRPRYGGVVERVIGTLMELVDTLPGTTFSNVTEREVATTATRRPR